MKILFSLFLGLFLYSCQTFQFIGRNPAQSQKSSVIKKHYIVAVHGIGGDETTFGSMKTVLIDHLKKIRPETEFVFLNFSYPTGNSELTTFDFAYTYLSEFLHQKIPHVESDERITFVAHSQGGIVTSIWYAGAALGVDKDGDFNSDVAQRIKLDQKYSNIAEQIITLGTPFWGSKLATYLNDNDRLQLQKLPGLGCFFNLGDNELSEMSFLSNTIYSFRQTAIALSHNPKYSGIRSPEFIQIAGVYPRDEKKLFYNDQSLKPDSYLNVSQKALHFIYKYFSANGFSSEKINSSKPDRPESDVAVIVPSSRSEFIFSNQSLSCHSEPTSFESFSKASVFKDTQYYLTEAIHSPIVSESSVGIASIPSLCADAEKCQHPSYRILLKSLAHCDKYSCDSEAYQNIVQKQFELNRSDESYNMFLTNGTDLQGFSVELNLKVPANYDFPVQYYYSRMAADDFSNNQTWILKQKEIFQKLIKPRFDLIPKDQTSIFEIKSARQQELYSSLVQWKSMNFRKVDATHLRVQMTGLLKPRTTDLTVEQSQIYSQILKTGAVFPFEIHLPKYIDLKPKTHLINAQIKPGYSTFIDLDYRNAIDCQ